MAVVFGRLVAAGMAWLLALAAAEAAWASEALQRRTLQRPDGSTLVFHVTAKPAAPGLFLVAQGSGCESARPFRTPRG